MAPVARRLCDRFRILEPLQRRSGAVPLTVARHVADLHEVLRVHSPEGPVRLAGYSWGAMLALTYAARHPATVDRVILIGCGTFDVQSRRVYQARIQRRMTAAERRRIQALHTQLVGEEDRQRRDALFAQLGGIYERIQSCRLCPAHSQDVLSCDEAGFRQTWADALFLQESGVQPAEFARVKAPVIMIHGSEDPHPGALIHQSLVPLVRDIQFQELRRCGHKPWVEQEAKEKFHELLATCLG
jgi:pimeloyl-ACP methyl ester carboxylesterase